jgi:hypothetical protein
MPITGVMLEPGWPQRRVPMCGLQGDLHESTQVRSYNIYEPAPGALTLIIAGWIPAGMSSASHA